MADHAKRKQVSVIHCLCKQKDFDLAKAFLAAEFGLETALLKIQALGKFPGNDIRKYKFRGFAFIFKGEKAKRRAEKCLRRVVGLKWELRNMHIEFDPYEPIKWIRTDGSVSFPKGKVFD